MGRKGGGGRRGGGRKTAGKRHGKTKTHTAGFRRRRHHYGGGSHGRFHGSRGGSNCFGCCFGAPESPVYNAGTVVAFRPDIPQYPIGVPGQNPYNYGGYPPAPTPFVYQEGAYALEEPEDDCCCC